MLIGRLSDVKGHAMGLEDGKVGWWNGKLVRDLDEVLILSRSRPF